MAIEFQCTCGQSLQTDDETAGMIAQCPSCGSDMTIPAAYVQPEGRAGAPSCPGCGASLEPSAVLCIQCGLHLVTGERLSTIQASEEAPGAPAAPQHVPRHARHEEASDEEPGTLWSDLGRAFTYPVRGSAIWLVAGVGFGGLVFAFIPFGGILFFALRYACLIDIMRSAASGPKHRPEMPDFTNLWEGMLRPALRVFFSGIIVVGIPMFAAFSIAGTSLLALLAGGEELTAVALITGSAAILAAGLFSAIYFPMTLTVVGIYDSLIAGLDPRVVIRSIIRIPGEYFATCALAWVMMIAGYATTAPLSAIPIAGLIIGEAALFYCLAVAVAALGFMAYRNKAKLGWHV